MTVHEYLDRCGGQVTPTVGDIPTVLRLGLTVRDWFAGQAMAAMIQTVQWRGSPWDELASAAYSVADALLVERAQVLARTAEG